MGNQHELWVVSSSSQSIGEDDAAFPHTKVLFLMRVLMENIENEVATTIVSKRKRQNKKVLPLDDVQKNPLQWTEKIVFHPSNFFTSSCAGLVTHV